MSQAKLKAEELIEKYLRLEDDTTFYWEGYFDRRMFDEEVLDHAIKCAIVAVDSILNALDDTDIIYGSEYRYQVSDFYNEVKTELLKKNG